MRIPRIVFAAILIIFVALSLPSSSPAADTELKSGDTIGPNNWQRIQGMVGDNFLNRIKAGHSLQIKPAKTYRHIKEYTEATDKYAAKVRLGANGELVGYVAGQPFPKFETSDPQIGQKLAWNFFLALAG
jgi:hypothetical protein